MTLTPTPSCKKKKLLWGMLLEMIEMDPCSLSYQGAVPNKFKGSLAFFQKRCCLIYCNAYLLWCLHSSLSTWPWETSAGKYLPWQPHSSGREEPSSTAAFLICYWCAQSACFLVVVCQKGFQACKLLLLSFLFGSFWNSLGILKKNKIK